MAAKPGLPASRPALFASAQIDPKLWWNIGGMQLKGIHGEVERLQTDAASRYEDRRFIMLKKTCVWLIAAIFLAGTASILGACNTVEGAGKDIEQGGKAIKDEANEQKR